MNAALRDAETGYFSDARRQTKAALKIAATRDVKILAALALARSGEITEPKRMADDLAQQFPLNTVVNSYWLPTIRASIELNRADAAKAIDILKSTASHEWACPEPRNGNGQISVSCVRARAGLLSIRKGTEAIVELRKILDHPGIVQNCILGALAAWASHERTQCAGTGPLLMQVTVTSSSCGKALMVTFPYLIRPSTKPGNCRRPTRPSKRVCPGTRVAIPFLELG